MEAEVILWIALTIGGIVGGILTVINKFRFVGRKEFDDHKQTCPVAICAKVDAVKASVNGLQKTVDKNAEAAQKRRDADKQELHDSLYTIGKFMGGVERFMKEKNHKG